MECWIYGKLSTSSCAGQAWVGLRVKLGPSNSTQDTVHPTPSYRKMTYGPSRVRRQNRRAAARAARAEEVAAENQARTPGLHEQDENSANSV